MRTPTTQSLSFSGFQSLDYGTLIPFDQVLAYLRGLTAEAK
jgi:hypothetical protein